MALMWRNNTYPKFSVEDVYDVILRKIEDIDSTGMPTAAAGFGKVHLNMQNPISSLHRSVSRIFHFADWEKNKLLGENPGLIGQPRVRDCVEKYDFLEYATKNWVPRTSNNLAM